MRAAYTGTEALTFTQYTDAETGRTLHAEPGGVYDVIPGSGHTVPEIPVPWFAPADEQDRAAPDMWPPEAEAQDEQEPAEPAAEG